MATTDLATPATAPTPTPTPRGPADRVPDASRISRRIETRLLVRALLPSSRSGPPRPSPSPVVAASATTAGTSARRASTSLAVVVAPAGVKRGHSVAFGSTVPKMSSPSGAQIKQQSPPAKKPKQTPKQTATAKQSEQLVAAAPPAKKRKHAATAQQSEQKAAAAPTATMATAPAPAPVPATTPAPATETRVAEATFSTTPTTVAQLWSIVERLVGERAILLAKIARFENVLEQQQDVTDRNASSLKALEQYKEVADRDVSAFKAKATVLEQQLQQVQDDYAQAKTEIDGTARQLSAAPRGGDGDGDGSGEVQGNAAQARAEDAQAAYFDFESFPAPGDAELRDILARCFDQEDADTSGLPP